ncbi:MAG: hypothetical protein QM820_09920 [Minicystis sp.]
MLEAIKPLLPSGWAIDEPMFRSLGDADRSRIEARYQTLPDTPQPRRSRTSAEGPASVATAQGVVAPGSSIEGFGKTVGSGSGKAAEGTSAGAGKSPRAVVIGGAAAALVAGGLLALKLLGPSPAGPPVVAATSTSAPTASPSATADATAKPHTVRLVILPEGATVEVDGAPIPVKDGVVEVTGTLGSVHEVRVSMDGEQTTRNVVVAESGPVPAKVQLDVKPPKPGETKPAGPAVRPSGPKPPAAPDLRNQR